MFRKVLMTIGLLLMANFVLAQGTIKGTVTDPKTKEPVPFANVVAKQGGKQIKGTQTDINGNFTLKPLEVGKYDIQVSSVGYATYTREGFNVKATGISPCNIEMTATSKTLETVEIKEAKNPIIDIGSAESGQRINADDIAHMPGTSLESIVAAVGGVGYNDGGTGSARGEGGMVTQVNGIRKRSGVNVPKSAIAEIQVVLGGTPAHIGEAIGGSQLITLKPPTSQIIGELRYNATLNSNLSNSASLYISGPLFHRNIYDENGEKSGDVTLIGFRATLSGSYNNNGYHRARGYSYSMINDDIVRYIEQNPLSYDPINGVVNYTAESMGLRSSDFVDFKFLTAKDFNGDKSRVPHTGGYSVAGNLELVARPSDYVTISITGEGAYSLSRGSGLDPLNMPRVANGVNKNIVGSISFNISQRFPDEVPSANNADGESAKAKLVTDVKYNIKGMYEREKSQSYNEVFGSSIDDIFKYGFNGSVKTYKQRTYALVSNFDYYGSSRAAMVQDSWVDRIDWSTYDPYSGNQILANYNLQLLSIPDLQGAITDIDRLHGFRGLANGDLAGSVYGLISNVGSQSTGFAYSQTDRIYLAANANATIAGNHKIEIGFQYDRLDESYYGISASGMYTLMRQLANKHLTQLDLSNPHYRWEGSTLYVDYDRLYLADQQSKFDRVFREYLGQNIVDNTEADHILSDYERQRAFLDVDRYTPEQYAAAGGINMFTADELFNNGNPYVSYYGYDHTGKKFNSSSWNLKDFYASSDPDYRTLPAFRPTYMAGYIEDQFDVNDLIFNVGVRVDMYDANQAVLKDPYLLYPSHTVGDLRRGDAAYQGNIYAGAGDDWTVYVDAADADLPTIYGYRNGSVWYDANGVEVSTPADISGISGKPTPYRTEAGRRAVANNAVDVDAFTDYKLQVVPQPRIAFSFPVGEASQFKANYEIIARRPSSNWQAPYLSYLFFSQVGQGALNNPNLKPERVTNYELSFEQALNKSTAVSAAAFYRETRDLIQIVQFAGADPASQYYSYDNLDFKTIKGLTLGMNMRQSRNITIMANYTLQYAEGTGLSQATMLELIKEGYTTLKMLNPIGDDRRHEFKVDLDYRFIGGAKYNGPTWDRVVKDKETGEERKQSIKLLENFGVHVTAVAQSGAPYTRAFSHNQPNIVGSYRGARLPWGFYLNLSLDKAFMFGTTNHPKSLVVSLYCQNPLDIRNTIAVYPVTGNPDDNGYLTDPETQTAINSNYDPQFFRDLYAWNMSTGWNFSRPRTFVLSLMYNF